MKKTTIFSCLLAFLLTFPWVHNYGQIGQNRVQVSGVVMDSNKEPLTGVTVQLKGAGSGTITDIDGKYTINVPPGKATLVFSYVGFQTIEMSVKSSILNVEMQELVKELDDVVVIGYGQAKKRDITGAISSVSSKDIDAQTPVNVFDALQGQVAGVEIVTGSGAPGESSVVRVRGTATFEAGASPLYVVDGVIYDNIDDLNPEDIESIEVLKDAASAAIYGSRSANGVFLITTKQGESKTKLDIRYVRSYSNYIRKMPQTNSEERKYYDFYRRKISTERNETAVGFTPLVDTLAYFTNQDQDLQELLFQTAVRNDINMTASGATDVFKYYINAGYLDETGIIVNSGYNRITSRVNAEYKPSKKLTIGNKIYFSYSNKKGIDEAGVLNQLLERIPYWAVFNPDGTYTGNVSSRRNPYAVAMTDIDLEQNYKATLYEYLTYKFDKRFTFSTNLQTNFNLRREQFYRPTPQLHSTERTTGRDYSTLNYDWTNENFLSYKQTFKRNHTVDAMLGGSIQRWHREQIRLVGYDYTTDEIYTLNAASDYDIKSTYTRIFEHSMVSFFGRAGYNYKSRYLFNANLRYDGSSRFGPDSRWGWFPSASAAWRFSDETFTRWMKPFISDAKLRVSYGVTGNESIGDYAWMTLYRPDFIYEDENMNMSGISQATVSFPGLSWEETAQFNVGLDLFMMKNRIKFVADYYTKKTDRLLNQLQLPKETGYNSYYKNVGGMTNEGLELAVSWDAIRNKKFRWTLNVNFTTNNCVIDNIPDGIPFYKGTNDAIYIQEGARLGEFYGYKFLRIFPYDESNSYSDKWEPLTPHFNPDGSFKEYTLNGQKYDTDNRKIFQKKAVDGTILRGGDVDFVDTNGDGTIDMSDKDYIGCAQPDFFGGASTTISYRNFSLFASLYYSIGGKIYNYAEAKRNQFRQDGATPSPEAIHNMWTKQGDEARFAAPYVSEHNMLWPSDFYLEDASYIKLKNVKLSYDVPSKFAKKIFLRSASLYVYGKNLLTLTDYTGYDPEFSDSSDPLNMGIDTNKYPRKRELGFGINIGF